MANERTLVLCKPDAIQRGHVGEIVSRFESKGLKIAGMKMLHVGGALANRHYQEHVEKAFYPQLREFITSSPVIAMVIEGDNAVDVVRALIGVTNPQLAAPGTIRGDLGINFTKNLVHGSDSTLSAQREISLFFDENELFDYAMTIGAWL